MKSKLYVFLFTLLLISLILSPHQIKSASQKMQFTAEVAHTRTIIVDQNLKIISIYSNTKKDVVPTVRLENEKGDIIAITDRVSDQYKALKPSLNFSKIGKVYDRDTIKVFDIALPQKVSNLIHFVKQLFLIKH